MHVYINPPPSHSMSIDYCLLKIKSLYNLDAISETINKGKTKEKGESIHACLYQPPFPPTVWVVVSGLLNTVICKSNTDLDDDQVND